jgi:DNA-binding transcriptional LysR family regulator
VGARPPGRWLYLKNGRLEQVLPQFHTPDANIHAMYPQRHQLAARVRAFVDFMALSLNQQTGTSA